MRASKYAAKIRAKVLQMRKARALARRNRANRETVRPASAACWEQDEDNEAQTEQPPREVIIVTPGGIRTHHNQQQMRSRSGTSESKVSEPSHGSPRSSGASSVCSRASRVYEPVGGNPGVSYGQCDEHSDDECCASVSGCSSDDSDGDVIRTDSDSESSRPSGRSGPSIRRRIYSPEPISSVYAALDRASHVLGNSKGGSTGRRYAGVGVWSGGLTGEHDTQLPPESVGDLVDRWAKT